MFGRSWVRFLSGPEIFSLSHACVMLNNSSLTIFFVSPMDDIESWLNVTETDVVSYLDSV